MTMEATAGGGGATGTTSSGHSTGANIAGAGLEALPGLGPVIAGLGIVGGSATPSGIAKGATTAASGIAKGATTAAKTVASPITGIAGIWNTIEGDAQYAAVWVALLVLGVALIIMGLGRNGVKPPAVVPMPV